ncbi:MAG TPA: FHA domain-containing protein [Ktedonobacterales bacterium]|nr:FHA domain-containing protein [Ktedonobacterales bacterium]
MDLQLDQFLFILRIVLVALIYLFLIQLIFVVRRDLVRMVSGAATARVGTTAYKGLGYLVVVKPGPMPLRPGHHIELEPVTTIGRGPTNTIVLEDSRISSEHTRLTYHDRQWWVEDLGSRNKTFLNGSQVPVGQSIPARPGDLLVLGPMDGVVTFKFGV